MHSYGDIVANSLQILVGHCAIPPHTSRCWWIKGVIMTNEILDLAEEYAVGHDIHNLKSIFGLKGCG
jgi:hypothetical protein